MKYVSHEELQNLRDALCDSTLRELKNLAFIIENKPELLINRIRTLFHEAGLSYYDSFCAAFEVHQFLCKYTLPFKESFNVHSQS